MNKTTFIIFIILLVFIACSKDEETVTPSENTQTNPITNCVIEPRFTYTLQDEIDGNIPKDSLYFITSNLDYNLYIYGTMSDNNDSYNDFLRFDLLGLSQSIMPDSSFLIVKDFCNNTYYNSRFDATGTVDPIWLYPTWNGKYAPDSISYHQPTRQANEGRYQYEYKIYLFDSDTPTHIITAEVDLTRP
jgi:hypothetical protein